MLNGKPRDAFLEFLRNLTPQGLFLACFFILAKQFEKPLPEDKTILLAGCFGCFIVFLLAFIGNFTKFADAIFDSQNEAFKISTERIDKSAANDWWKLCRKLIALWKYDKSTFFQFLLAVIIAYISLFPIVIIALDRILKKA